MLRLEKRKSVAQRHLAKAGSGAETPLKEPLQAACPGAPSTRVDTFFKFTPGPYGPAVTLIRSLHKQAPNVFLLVGSSLDSGQPKQLFSSLSLIWLYGGDNQGQVADLGSFEVPSSNQGRWETAP